jgi:uncharacterized protein YjeT (DUF2065 family)
MSTMTAEVPHNLTQLKKTFFLEDFSYEQRIIGLVLVTVGFIGITRRSYFLFIIANNPLVIFKNTLFTYFGLGFFIAPEIWNHKINSN